jgi:hypothetical protein
MNTTITPAEKAFILPSRRRGQGVKPSLVIQSEGQQPFYAANGRHIRLLDLYDEKGVLAGLVGTLAPNDDVPADDEALIVARFVRESGEVARAVIRPWAGGDATPKVVHKTADGQFEERIVYHMSRMLREVDEPDIPKRKGRAKAKKNKARSRKVR